MLVHQAEELLDHELDKPQLRLYAFHLLKSNGSICYQHVHWQCAQLQARLATFQLWWPSRAHRAT